MAKATKAAAAKAAPRTTPTPEPIPTLKTALNDRERADLGEAAVRALENNLTLHLTDGADRQWFVAPDRVANHATVLIQVKRGETERHINLSTATFTPERVANAMTELDAATAA